MGVLPSPAEVCLFSFFRRYAGNTFSLFHSSIRLCANFRALLLYRCVAGNLEMSPLQAIILQGRVSPELIWGQMLLLRPSEMGRFGSGQRHFNATIPVRLEGATSKQIRSAARVNFSQIICGAAKANEDFCGDGFYFDGGSNALRFFSVFDTDSFSLFVSWALSLSDGGMPLALRYRVLFHPELAGYDAIPLAGDHKEGEERRHAPGHFREEL